MSTYQRYLLSFLWYHLSVHNVHETHLNKLDMLAKTFLKKWLNILSRGVSDITFFHPQLLGSKPPSNPESHSGNYKVIFKADKVVNAALDAGLEREVLHSCQM